MNRLMGLRLALVSLVALNAAAVSAQASEPQALVLLTAIPPSIDARGNLPVLMEDADGRSPRCRFAGVLVKAVPAGPDPNFRLVHLNLPNSPRWWIHVRRQQCAGVDRDVPLTIAMPQEWDSEFDVGRHLHFR